MSKKVKKVIAVAVIIAAVVGVGVAALAGAFSTPPTAAAVVKSDGYTVRANSSIGISANGLPGSPTSLAWGTNGNSVEIAAVYPSNTAANNELAAYQSNLAGSGLIISEHSDAVTIDGTINTFVNAGF